MTYPLEFSGKAKKDILSLDSVIQKRISKKLQFFLAQEDPLVFAMPLVNNKDGNYRWRIGHYRVVFDVNNNVILILRVLHRGEVYKT